MPIKIGANLILKIDSSAPLTNTSSGSDWGGTSIQFFIFLHTFRVIDRFDEEMPKV